MGQVWFAELNGENGRWRAVAFHTHNNDCGLFLNTCLFLMPFCNILSIPELWNMTDYNGNQILHTGLSVQRMMTLFFVCNILSMKERYVLDFVVFCLCPSVQCWSNRLHTSSNFLTPSGRAIVQLAQPALQNSNGTTFNSGVIYSVYPCIKICGVFRRNSRISGIDTR